VRKLIIILLLSSGLVQAQQALTDHYQFNLMALNPAFTGTRGNFGVTGLLGQQFNGTFSRNQVSQVIVLDGKVGSEQRGAFGFQGFRSAITGFTNSGLSLSYAHSFEAGDIKVNAGLNFGFIVSPNVVGTQDFIQRFNPYGGPGVTAIGGNFFAGVGAPTLFGKRNTFSPPPKNLNLQGGYKLGNDDNVAVNISGLAGLPMDNNSPLMLHINAKLWLGSKIGIGGSFRNQKYLSQSASKIIPSIEARVSESSTIGLSYDNKPLLFEGFNDNSRNPKGVFQLIYRYDVFNFNDTSSFLNRF
jgi:type IX secretion system PorP/SprF family membrane protein